MHMYLQVVAVEGINNYSGVLIPSTIYDEVSLRIGQPDSNQIYTFRVSYLLSQRELSKLCQVYALLTLSTFFQVFLQGC